MFDGGLPIPPLPPDAMPIGPGGQLMLALLIGFLLVAVVCFFFEICDALMDEESQFRRDWAALEPRDWVKRLQAWWKR